MTMQTPLYDFISKQTVYQQVMQAKARKRAAVISSKVKGTEILDFGCGSLHVASHLAKLHPDITLLVGIDRIVYPDMHHLNGPPLRFVHAQGNELPFEDNSFDTSYAIGAFHHNPSTNYILPELWRVTRPNGALVVCEETWSSYVGKAVVIANDMVHNAYKPHPSLHFGFHTQTEWLRLFEGHQFTVLDAETRKNKRFMEYCVYTLQPKK